MMWMEFSEAGLCMSKHLLVVGLSHSEIGELYITLDITILISRLPCTLPSY